MSYGVRGCEGVKVGASRNNKCLCPSNMEVPCRCEEGERGCAGCSLGTAIPGYPCGRREGTMPGSVRAVESNNPMFNTHRQQLQNQGRCWIDFS